MKYDPIQQSIIAAGVKNLREYGYPDVTTENIFSDPIYSRFFASMLQDNIGRGFDIQVRSLLSQVEAAQEDDQ